MGFLDDANDWLNDNREAIQAVGKTIAVSGVGVSNPSISATSIVTPGSAVPVAQASSVTPEKSGLQKFLDGFNAVAGSVQQTINGLHPTVYVRGDVAGTLSDAKSAMPWWLLPAGAGFLLFMLLKPSGGGRRRY